MTVPDNTEPLADVVADVRTDDDTEVAVVSAEDGPARPAKPRSMRLSLGIAAAIVTVDQLTKHWALNALGDGRSRHVFWTMHWNLTYNSGMAFSRAQGIGPYIGAAAFVVVIVLVFSLRRSKGIGSPVAVGLVIGGAVGNLCDRLFREQGWLRGRVIDFIDFEWWPIFNVADMGVTVGGLLIAAGAIFESRRHPG